MNRKQRRKWLRKPEFKRQFSDKDRETANDIIVNIQNSSRKMEESNNLNGERLTPHMISQKLMNITKINETKTKINAPKEGR